MPQYQFTNYIFSKIDPAKKYSQFTYSDMTFEEMNCGYCQKDEILKIDGVFYLYKGSFHVISDNENYKPYIMFKDRNKIVKQIFNF